MLEKRIVADVRRRRYWCRGMSLARVLAFASVLILPACIKPKSPAEPPVESSGREQARQPKEREQAEPPRRLGNTQPPAGFPAPHAVCGHAIAFAGWKASVDGAEDAILFHDPADNAFVAEKHVHLWEAAPNESILQFGARRPSLVLDSASLFTVVGAVMMVPQQEAKANEPITGVGDSMPDLSQSLGDQWPGLCGPTSAADILYAIGSRRPLLLKGIERGPSDRADRDAARLIVGEGGRVIRQSLAARMKLRDDGNGVTNEGIRAGVAEWLDDRDAGNWSVQLAWLNDDEKDPEEQRRFFRELSENSRLGGGAVLCLWPGAEFAESSTDASERNGAGQADDEPVKAGQSTAAGGVASGDEKPGKAAESGRPQSAENNARPGVKETRAASNDEGNSQSTAADGRAGFDGKPFDPVATDAALSMARKAMDRTRRALARGDEDTAIDAIAEAISTLRPHAAGSPECRAALGEANELAELVEAAMPEQKAVSDKPTSFE